MWKCKNCQEESEDSFDSCWNCGLDTKGKKQANFEKTKQSPSSDTEGSPIVQNVVVTDIKMSFSSMVEFMVKWAIASIPALIILFFIGMALAALIAGLGFSIFK